MGSAYSEAETPEAFELQGACQEDAQRASTHDHIKLCCAPKGRGHLLYKLWRRTSHLHEHLQHQGTMHAQGEQAWPSCTSVP